MCYLKATPETIAKLRCDNEALAEEARVMMEGIIDRADQASERLRGVMARDDAARGGGNG